MEDFIRIGGEIISNPLNENFRRLRNDISIANANLIFSYENGVVNNKTELEALKTSGTVVNGQVCYVISTGSLYRYTTTDNDWHIIADFGDTFRQGFLNSGIIALQYLEGGVRDYISKTNNTLHIPACLAYFKNKAGDDAYGLGVYKIAEANIDLDTQTFTTGTYSIYLDGSLVGIINGETQSPYIFIKEKPTTDDVNKIYMGGFVVDNQNEVVSQFIYTIPNLAYTSDRSFFYLTGGQVKGGAIQGATNTKKIAGKIGSYYAEGINVSQSNINDYPVGVYTGADSNLRNITALDPLDKLIYIYPTSNPLSAPIVDKQGAVDYNHYYDLTSNQLKTVATGKFTIQRHLLTPCGFDCTDVMIYGTKVYNSLMDAEANINDAEPLELDFPYVEITRMVVGSTSASNFSTDPSAGYCKYYSMERLAQVGTLEPKFADTQFILYSGDTTDTTPARAHFLLDALESESPRFEGDYYLYFQPSGATRHLFGINKKYIDEGITPQSVTQTLSEIRTTYSKNGYNLADDADISYLRDRVSNIEKEIWDIHRATTSSIYEQSIRYRLSQLEHNFSQYATDIDLLNKNKVNKTTKINGYTLGDTANYNEAKSVTIYTGDITEGKGKGSNSNLWYTDARVTANTSVQSALNHISAHGTGTVSPTNPHGLSTDDITVLSSGNNKFMTTAEKTKLGNVPADTNSSLATINTTLNNLENNKIEYITINKLNGASITGTGSIKTLQFNTNGTNVTINGSTATIECVGQSLSDAMRKSDYATMEHDYPDIPDYHNAVDKAVVSLNTYNLYGAATAGNDKYYGTDDEGTPGFISMPHYVTTEVRGSQVIDNFIFEPESKSIKLKHLADNTITYGSTDEETTLDTNLHDLVVNHYHTVLNNGSVVSSSINKWNFGDNLNVTVNNGTATINATGSGSGGSTAFSNLSDVSVTYSDENLGKMLILDKNAGTDNQYKIVLAEAPNPYTYMTISTYTTPGDVTMVKKASQAITAQSATTATTAESADWATTALSLQNTYTVDDTKTTGTYLWTTNKIQNYVNTQINTTVKTYSGTSVPSASLGKDGDIYILIES